MEFVHLEAPVYHVPVFHLERSRNPLNASKSLRAPKSKQQSD